MTIRENVRALAEEAASMRGCSLYDIYAHRDRFQALIERGKPPAALEDCEKVFSSLAFLLKREIPGFFQKWRLEVSTPGLERKLREKRHFKDSIGYEVRARSAAPLPVTEKRRQKEGGASLQDTALTRSGEALSGKENRSGGRRQAATSAFCGTLVSFDNETVKLSNKDGAEWQAPFEKITMAQRVFVYPAGKPSQKNRKRSKGGK